MAKPAADPAIRHCVISRAAPRTNTERQKLIYDRGSAEAQDVEHLLFLVDDECDKLPLHYACIQQGLPLIQHHQEIFLRGLAQCEPINGHSPKVRIQLRFLTLYLYTMYKRLFLALCKSLMKRELVVKTG